MRLERAGAFHTPSSTPHARKSPIAGVFPTLPEGFWSFHCTSQAPLWPRRWLHLACPLCVAGARSLPGGSAISLAGRLPLWWRVVEVQYELSHGALTYTGDKTFRSPTCGGGNRARGYGPTVNRRDRAGLGFADRV